MVRAVRASVCVLFGILSACEGAPRSSDGVPEAVLRARREAEREACLRRALAERAREDVAVLDTARAHTPAGSPTAAVQAAAYRFALAYARHAEAQAAAAALRDSALNLAASPADSLRYLRAAAAARPAAPPPGTVEANAAAQYAQAYAALAADPQHPCNAP